MCLKENQMDTSRLEASPQKQPLERLVRCGAAAGLSLENPGSALLWMTCFPPTHPTTHPPTHPATQPTSQPACQPTSQPAKAPPNGILCCLLPARGDSTHVNAFKRQLFFLDSDQKGNQPSARPTALPPPGGSPAALLHPAWRIGTTRNAVNPVLHLPLHFYIALAWH